MEEEGAEHFGQTISVIAQMGKVGKKYNPGARFHDEPGFNICDETPANP